MKRPQPRIRTPAQDMKLLAGLAVQPFQAAVVAFVGFPLFLLDGSGRNFAGGFPADRTDAAMSVALGVAMVVLFITGVGVFPTALWIVRRRSVTLTQALLFGLGFANLPILVWTMLVGSHGVAGSFRGYAFASLIGLTGAATFWLISLREPTLNHDAV